MTKATKICPIILLPAFPTPERADPGMTMREFYAGLALSGILANPEPWGYMTVTTAVEMSVSHADALLEELAKWEPSE